MYINPNLEWEPLDTFNDCWRMKVYGGWIFKQITHNIHTIVLDRGNEKTDTIYNTSLQFIPDPEHAWLKKEALKNLLLNPSEG